MSTLEARVLSERWRREYNERRPHGALGYRTPQQVLEQASKRVHYKRLDSQPQWPRLRGPLTFGVTPLNYAATELGARAVLDLIERLEYGVLG